MYEDLIEKTSVKTNKCCSGQCKQKRVSASQEDLSMGATLEETTENYIHASLQS